MIFLKDNIIVNIYDNFMYDSFIRKILIKTVYFFHSSFLNFTWRHFLIFFSYFL